MSAYSLEAAHSERTTAVHQNSGAQILDVYVRHAPGDSGFPISGDMIAMINRGKRGPLERRRRRAARIIMEHEVTQC